MLHLLHSEAKGKISSCRTCFKRLCYSTSRSAPPGPVTPPQRRLEPMRACGLM